MCSDDIHDHELDQHDRYLLAIAEREIAAGKGVALADVLAEIHRRMAGVTEDEVLEAMEGE